MGFGSDIIRATTKRPKGRRFIVHNQDQPLQNYRGKCSQSVLEPSR